MVEGEGFEPSKAEPSDLQSDPFGHSGTPPQRKKITKKRWWREKDSNLRRLSRQIYSLIPLATREPLRAFLYHLLYFYTLTLFVGNGHYQQVQQRKWWREKDSNLRRRSRQIYSLIPLATREPLLNCGRHSMHKPFVCKV